MTTDWSQIDWEATGTVLSVISAAVFGVAGFVLGLLGFLQARRSTTAAEESTKIARHALEESRRANEIAERSAAGSERSAIAAEGAVVASRDAARAAEESSRHEGRAADIEVERRHHELDPAPSAEFSTISKRRPQPEERYLRAEIAVQHTCRLAVWALDGETRRELVVPSGVVTSQMPARVDVEPMSDVHGDYKTDALLIRMWPAQAADPGGAWGCPCPRPNARAEDQPGHWEARLPIDRVKRPGRVVVPRGDPYRPGGRLSPRE